MHHDHVLKKLDFDLFNPPQGLEGSTGKYIFLRGNSLREAITCSNHEIHVMFEHGFYLKMPKLGPTFYA